MDMQKQKLKKMEKLYSQMQFDFESRSPINAEKLSGQNKKLYEYLANGKHITRYEAEKLFHIGNLHSRISDLKNKYGISIKSEMIQVLDFFNQKTNVKKYWIDGNI